MPTHALPPSLPPTSTASHRPALMAFHDIVLSLDGEGGWSLHQGHRSGEAKAAAAAQLAAAGQGAKPDARFALPLPPRPAADAFASTEAAGAAKVRGSEADAVLAGMTAGGSPDAAKQRRRRGKRHGKGQGAQGKAAAGQAGGEQQEEELQDGNEGFAGAPIAYGSAEMHAGAGAGGVRPPAGCCEGCCVSGCGGLEVLSCTAPATDRRRDGHRSRAPGRRGGRCGAHVGTPPGPHALQAVAAGALEGGL